MLRVHLLTAGCILISLLAWSIEALAQQDLRPRVVPAKPTLEELRGIRASHQVIVKFREGSGVRIHDGKVETPFRDERAAFEATLRSLGISLVGFRRFFARPEADYDREREVGQRRTGDQLADLNLYYVFNLPAGMNGADVAHELNKLNLVERAEPGRLPPPVPIDIPPRTDNYTSRQGYKGPPPNGIFASSDSEILGSSGIYNYADIERGWYLDHEDLDWGGLSGHYRQPPGCGRSDGANPDHGTAVLGVISGLPNDYGITGIAPGAEANVIPAGCDNTDTTAIAIDHAFGLGIRHVLLETQFERSCGTSFLGPSEELQRNFDSIKHATGNGIVVVEAAGNGNPLREEGLDLDSSGCNGRYNREIQDSGAIVVGAGSSDSGILPARTRKAGSNFGSRVDVQAWGENVVTTGYGDLFDPGDYKQRYTSTFNGTSSASAIVMGAILSINGARRSCGLPMLDSMQMRDLLNATGTPQVQPESGNIGPLPNIRAALAASPGFAACRPVLQVSGGDFDLLGIEGDGSPGFVLLLYASVGTVDYAIRDLPFWWSATPDGGQVDVSGASIALVPTSAGAALRAGTYGPLPVSFVNTTSGLGNTTRMATLKLRPRNDNFEYPIYIYGNYTRDVQIDHATKQTDEPDHAGKPGGHSVWWQLKVKTDGAIEIHTCNSKIDTVLAVYTGNSLNSLTTIASSGTDYFCGPLGAKASRVTFHGSAGTDYYIAVDSLTGDPGAIRLSVSVQ